MRKLIILVPLLTLIWTSMASAHGPVRQKVQEEIAINAPAEKVWEIIKTPCSMKQWHPEVIDCTLKGEAKKGAEIKVSLKNGGWIVEALKKIDDKKMTFSYKFNTDDISISKTIVHANKEIGVPVLPVANYSGSLTVKKVDDKTSKVIWKSAFYRAYMNNNPPEEMNEEAGIKAVTQFMTSGLENLKKTLETQ